MGSAGMGQDGASDGRGAPSLDRLALVLCTRDRPHLLVSALAAIEQTVPPEVERIVVDSGSVTDETAHVVAGAGVRYLRSDVPGLSIARNIGLDATARDFVVFTDDDCEVQPGCVQRLSAAFSRPVVAAATGTLRDRGTPLPAAAEVQPRVITSTLDGLDAGHGALMAFRVAALRELGGFDTVLGAGRLFGGAEDLDAFCRTLEAGYDIVHVPDAVVHHVFTRTDDDFVALNRAYGRGTGAMCRKWVRGGGRTGRALAAKAVRRAGVRLVRRLGERRVRRGHLAYLAGLWVGYRRAAGMPVRGLLFVDEHPPAPVELSAGSSRAGPSA